MSRTIATMAAAALALTGVSAQVYTGTTSGLIPYTGTSAYTTAASVSPPTPQFYMNSDLLSQIPQFNFASGTPQFYMNADLLSQIPQFNFASQPAVAAQAPVYYTAAPTTTAYYPTTTAAPVYYSAATAAPVYYSAAPTTAATTAINPACIVNGVRVC